MCQIWLSCVELNQVAAVTNCNCLCSCNCCSVVGNVQMMFIFKVSWRCFSRRKLNSAGSLRDSRYDRESIWFGHQTLRKLCTLNKSWINLQLSSNRIVFVLYLQLILVNSTGIRAKFWNKLTNKNRRKRKKKYSFLFSVVKLLLQLFCYQVWDHF